MAKVERKPKLIKNAIAYQNKTTPNSLTVQEWNHIINVLKTQTNLNTEYLDKLHYILFGSSTSDFIETPSLPEVDERLGELEQVQTDLQGQIDVIDDTLQNHESRIGELELFAENLETNITEEIEGALDNKADLVDGKVPLEQLPDVEDVLTGDITSHNHATEISNHNTSETAHSDIRQKVDEARAIAEGKVGAMSFETKAQLDAWLLIPENVETLIVGTNFYIEDLASPDYWWNGTTIVELSTDKIDLTEYAKKTELLTLGTTSNDAYRGDLGQTAYEHSQSTHAPSNAQKNVQSDWNQTDNTKDDYIKNKPTIPTKTSDLTNDSGFITNAYDNTTSNLTATTIPTAIDELASRINNISIADNITVSDGELTLNTINSTTLTITYTDGVAELQIG